MLSRLVLLAAQLGVGWVATPSLLALLPPVAGLQLFAYALVAAVVVVLVGLALSQILRDTRPPSRGTLALSIGLALAGAALVYWRDLLPPELRASARILRDNLYPLLGAVLGYALKR